MTSAVPFSSHDVALSLLAYCRKHDWKGYDPYDGLNSRVFQWTPLCHSRVARLVLTQFMKRSPVNLRSLLMIPESSSSKSTALFLSAVTRLRKIGFLEDDSDIRSLAETLLQQRSEGQGFSCWGYSFDWQQRVNFVPKKTPNIICTTFAGNALLDAQDFHGDARYSEICRSAADFLIRRLYHEDSEGSACFSYIPQEQPRVHNANFLGAAYLCRVSNSTGDESLMQPAIKAARFSIAKQMPDGSWYYGEAETQRWIDNFHTGFNLCALHNIAQYSNSTEFDEPLRRGLSYYLSHFFCSDGAPRYFHHSTYPIDIHAVAQSIITLLTLRHLDERAEPMAQAVYKWATTHMLDPAGFFYYQKRRLYTVKIPYIRWGQAWTLLALSKLLERESIPSSGDLANGYSESSRELFGKNLQ